MRSFEERKAEVFRRSENRIRERRKRYTRILTLGVSLCVILIICSVVILPGVKMDNKPTIEGNQITTDAEKSEVEGETTVLSKVHNFVSVSVLGEGNYQYIKNYSDVTEVFYQIYDIQEANGGYKDMVVETKPTLGGYEVPETGVDFGNATTDMEDDYIITMESADGTIREYTLNANVLFDKAFDREIILTEKQLAELKTVLGVIN